MKLAHTLFAQGDHRWMVFARDPSRRADVIDTNEYAVQAGEQILPCDPGGQKIFPAVFSALSAVRDPLQVKAIFASHQDPDVISSLALWLELNPKLVCYASRLWTTFISHFGGDETVLKAIPDQGMAIALGTLGLQAFPAHFLHSSGNFHLYDPRARLLFSGDVGAALLPADAPLYVENFDAHIRHAEGFHRRWMGSNEATLDWCERAAKLGIELLCPQHGAVYRGANVERFINWFAELRVGALAATAAK
jgi:flavorubredoxin